MAQPRFAELCRRYPGPAAFVDGAGHVLDMNDAAPPMLDAVDIRAVADMTHAAGGELSAARKPSSATTICAQDRRDTMPPRAA